MARYDGGQITNGDVVERLNDERFRADAETAALPGANMSDVEKIARHLTAIRILVQTGRGMGLDKGPAWRLQARLTEERVLAQALIARTRREVQAATVSEKEVSEYYERHRFRIFGAQSIEARRIGISGKKHGAKALERAREAQALIRGGRDFVAVAKQYSDLDPKEAEPDLYSPDFWPKQGATALMDVGEGQVSEPLAVDDGYEIVKVEQINLPADVSPKESMEEVRKLLTEGAVAARMAELSQAASGSFPIVLAAATSQLSGNSAVVLRCGGFAATSEDVRAMAGQRGLNERDARKLGEMIRQEDGESIQLGELARSLGFDKHPDAEKALRDELDRQLADLARIALIPQYLSEVTFEEGRIREAYDKEWAATVDPQLQYDVIVVPPGVSGGATPDERGTAEKNALAKAKELIKRIRGGVRFEDVATGDATLHVMLGQSRLVPERSAIAPLVAAVRSGEVAAEPYEDFGGYCVIRVVKYEPRHKMPYELARGYIVDSFRRGAENDIRRSLEPVLLTKKRFVFDREAAEKICR